MASDTPELPAAGGKGSISVETSRDCPWSAAADAQWIALGSTGGQGPATVSFTVAPNPAGTPRRGHVSIAQQSVSVAQAPAPCRYDVSPSTVSVDAAEHQVAIALTSLEGCAWTVRADAPWVTGISPADGSGSASIRATIAANGAADARAATLAIGPASLRISQSGSVPPPAPPPEPPPPPPNPPTPPPACSYRLAPTSRTVGRGGDDFTVNVVAPSGCNWSVSTDAPWITIVDGRTGSGNGAFRLRVAPNGGAERSATVRAATQILTVQQAGGECRVSIKPTNYNAGRGPDNIRIAVSADPGCTWTTTTDAPWVTVAAGQSGSGDGVVRLQIPANDGPPRMAAIAIAGNTFTLRQEGSSCGEGASIMPTNYHAGRGPDDIRIKVRADKGCSWTATSSVSWVTVVEGSSGSGSGDVRLAVQPNDGPDRSVTLTIAGQPFDLRQDGRR